MHPTWDSSMETGYPSIDRQHRAIIGLIDDLEAAEAEDGATLILDVLDRIMDFTISHFGMEEDLMDAVDYPAEPTRVMTRQHREFTDYARIRVLEFRTTRGAGVEPLGGFLREWLVDHEFGLDRQLVDWIHLREPVA